MATAIKKFDCDKCHGTGIVDVYRKVDNGFCYKCNGSGKVGTNPNFNNRAEITETDSEEAYIMVDVYSEYKDDDGFYNIIGSRKEYI